MTSEQEERVRQIARAWMDFGFSFKRFAADKAVSHWDEEELKRIWDEESRIKKGA